MAKLYTPAMAKVDKRKAKEAARNKGKVVRSTPAMEAWKRLKRNKLAIVGMLVLAFIILIAIIVDSSLRLRGAGLRPPSGDPEQHSLAGH